MVLLKISTNSKTPITLSKLRFPVGNLVRTKPNIGTLLRIMSVGYIVK